MLNRRNHIELRRFLEGRRQLIRAVDLLGREAVPRLLFERMMVQELLRSGRQVDVLVLFVAWMAIHVLGACTRGS